MWILTKFIGLSPHQAVPVGASASVLILVVSVWAYISWIASSLSSYRLVLEGDNLLVRGRGGWRKIDRIMPISSIQKVVVGNPNVMERMYLGNRIIFDQVSSRLTFFPKVGKPFRVDFAVKAFENESLNEFFASIEARGVEVESGV